jgi:SAM-dependent methyltransferase
LIRKLLGDPHGFADDRSGGHVTAPRSYEHLSTVAFLGRRRMVFDRLVALAGIKPADRVLDVSCGTGYLTRRAAVATGAAGHVTGVVDPSAAVVEYASRVAPTSKRAPTRSRGIAAPAVEHSVMATLCHR